MRNTIYWVEIPVLHFERAKKFYETVFAIEIELVPNTRGKEGKYGIFPLDPAALGGGAAIIEGEGYMPSAKGALPYIDRGEDLAIPLARVEEAGGTIVKPKSENGGRKGFIAIFIDTEGNKIGLHSNN